MVGSILDIIGIALSVDYSSLSGQSGQASVLIY